jgi:DNA-binding response OmpR family regulator/HPt (histidine-containing phosphotransfer) domain-containing protein
MTPSDQNDQPARDPEMAELEAAWNEARERFVAGFPKRSDSIGYLLALVATLGDQGPVVPLREVVHKTAGLAGTVGFPSVSARARELEDLLDHAGDGLDVTRANMIFESIEDGFTTDLANPPEWAVSMSKADKQPRVMVVEDDEDQREVVGIHLRAAGYEPVFVPTGDVALSAAREYRPDLILLDANLPGLDGYSVCRLLKLDPDLAETPVIFTTVRSSHDDKIVGLLLGADDYLVKPLDMTELTLRIQLMLANRARRRDTRPAFALPDEGKELDFESFVALAREQLRLHAVALVLVRMPEPRLTEIYATLRHESRRRDLVACYGKGHIVQLLVEMPTPKAVDRLVEMMKRLGAGNPPRIQVGVAVSAGPGAKSFEMLLAEADEATVAARMRGRLVVVAGEPIPDRAEPVSKGTVVIADDDPEVTRLVDAQLKAAGYNTVVTSDGSQAVVAIEQHRPDIVIIDMMMPRMTGFDVLAAIRNNAVRPRSIILSARGREQDVTRAFALGADDYMTKPFSPQELLARVERLLR